MAQFQPGESGNKRGRPRGAKGKTPEFIRDNIRKFLARNLSKMQKDFDALEPKDRIALMERLFRHVLPAPGIDLEKLSEKDLDILIARLRSEKVEKNNMKVI